MKASDIVVGEFYRHKDSPSYWCRATDVLAPREGPNRNRFKVVRCVMTQGRDDKTGLVKYFKPSDLVKAGTKK